MLVAIFDVTLQLPRIQPFYTSNPSGITFTEVRIPLRDGNLLAGYAVLPANAKNLPPGSACLTILSPGVNGRKEAILWKAYNFARYGFFAIAIEARGHGFSTGICTIGIDEPRDISDAITWALNSYAAINSSRVSLYGQSLGGLFTVIAACQDSRVASSVVLHPPANFSKFLAPYLDVANLLGYLPSITLNEENLRLRSPINWINATAPRNILFIHGDKDTLVPPENSFSLSEKANASGHTDTFVVIRPGLTHPKNEADHYSLALGIAWLNWSLTTGKNPPPENLAAQAETIIIQEIQQGSLNVVTINLFIAVVGIFVLLFLISQNARENIGIPNTTIKNTCISISRKWGFIFFTITLSIAFVLGITNLVPFIWAYLLILPIVILGTYLLLGIYLARKGVPGTYLEEWRDQRRILNAIIGVGAVIGTAILYALLYSNLGAMIMQYGIFPWSTAPLFYSSIIVLNFIIDSQFLHTFHWGGSQSEPWLFRYKISRSYFKKLGKESLFVLAWRLGSAGLCAAFLPEINVMGLPINLFLILILPILATLVYFITGIMDLGTKNHGVSLLILGALVAMYLQWRLFRLF